MERAELTQRLHRHRQDGGIELRTVQTQYKHVYLCDDNPQTPKEDPEHPENGVGICQDAGLWKRESCSRIFASPLVVLYF